MPMLTALVAAVALMGPPTEKPYTLDLDVTALGYCYVGGIGDTIVTVEMTWDSEDAIPIFVDCVSLDWADAFLPAPASPAPPPSDAFKECVQAAVSTCTGGVASVTFTSGNGQTSCTFTCLGPPSASPPAPKKAD